MSRRVWVGGTDLLVRAKLAAAVAGAGASMVRDDGACDLAVVPAEMPGALARIRALVDAGVTVLAYAPHVRADLLRAAREAGATAVPNSEIERRVVAFLTSPAATPPPRSGGDEPSRPSAE